MTTTSITETAIRKRISTDPEHEHVNKREKFHKEIPYLLVATIAQGVLPDLQESLSAKVNEGGRARGRSGSATAAVEEEAMVNTPSLGIPQDQYVRPNGEIYVPRKWGVHTDVLVLRKAREKMQFVMLYGAPGCGKTALIEAAFGEKFYTLQGSGDTEVSDLIGSHVPTMSGNYIWVDGPLVRAAEEGVPFFIDEIGLVDSKVLAVLYGFMDGRREYAVTQNPERGTVKARDGFYVVSATNPNAPGVRLSEALKSRFLIQAEMTTDWDLARKLGVPNNIVTAAANLNKKQEKDEISWAPQMRELLAYRDNADIFGERFAVANLIAVSPEIDRAVVAEVFSRMVGDQVMPARI